MTMDNYPPGVTGMEDEISGPRAERDILMYCPDCRAHVYGCESLWRFGRTQYECYECGYAWDHWPEDDYNTETMPDEEAPF